MSEVITLTYSEAEAATRIGCSPKTLYRLRSEGKIPFRQIGNRTKYTKGDIEEILEILKKKPTQTTTKRYNSKIA